jgi:hypothetical protein
MASTYKIADAMNIVSRQLGRQVEDDYAAHIANVAMNKIWLAYDWKETMALLPPFYLIPGEQMYGAPFYAVPTDYLGIRTAYVTRAFSPTNKMELKFLADLRDTGVKGFPRNISYNSAARAFHLFPRMPEGYGATDWIVDGTYKKKPTKITAGALQTTSIPWDDLYFDVFVNALKWAAWDAAGDPRAGDIKYSGGNTILVGQVGKMYSLIDEMAEREGLNRGDPSIAPGSPLVIPDGYYGVFPGMGGL